MHASPLPMWRGRGEDGRRVGDSTRHYGREVTRASIAPGQVRDLTPTVPDRHYRGEATRDSSICALSLFWNASVAPCQRPPTG